MLSTATATGGWTVCPICGAIIADTWAHATWHETTLADVITDTTAHTDAPDPEEAPSEL